MTLDLSCFSALRFGMSSASGHQEILERCVLKRFRGRRSVCILEDGFWEFFLVSHLVEGWMVLLASVQLLSEL